MANTKISFQLYSARNFPPVDTVLEGLAAIGYDAVEPYGGNFLDDAKGFRAKADALGLAIPTAHVPLQVLDDDRARAIDLARTLGIETVILPHVGGDARPSDLAGWKAFSQRLGEHAGHLSQAGLKLPGTTMISSTRCFPTARARSTISLRRRACCSRRMLHGSGARMPALSTR